jgi:opacity protein-like surface antigen
MRLGLIAIMTTIAGSAMAETADWSYAVTPYIWVPGTSTSVGTAAGTITIEGDGGDTLSKLEMAFMGTFEARNGRWGLIADLIYADFDENKATPLGLLYGSANVSTKIAALSGYAAYRVYEDAQVKADLMGGFRAYSAKVDLNLSPGTLPGATISSDKVWVDPLIGGRLGMQFSPNWSADVAMDVGGFDPGQDFTWQAVGTVNYAFNDRWAMRAGWRYMDIETTIDGRDVGIELNGPIIGFQYNF